MENSLDVAHTQNVDILIKKFNKKYIQSVSLGRRYYKIQSISVNYGLLIHIKTIIPYDKF